MQERKLRQAASFFAKFDRKIVCVKRTPAHTWLLSLLWRVRQYARARAHTHTHARARVCVCVTTCVNRAPVYTQTLSLVWTEHQYIHKYYHLCETPVYTGTYILSLFSEFLNLIEVSGGPNNRRTCKYLMSTKSHFLLGNCFCIGGNVTGYLVAQRKWRTRRWQVNVSILIR
jgi:hypothetical protein